MNVETINKLFLELSQVATAKTAREIELEDLLTSVRSLAERYRESTAFELFGKLLADARIGSVTPRTFRNLPDDAPAPSVTADQIHALLQDSTVMVETIFDKVTLVSVRLPSGFVLTASSGAVSIENYSEEIGRNECMKKIKDQLWTLEGYALQKQLAC